MKNEAVEAVLADVSRQVREIASGPAFGPILDSLLAELMGAAGSGDDMEVLAPEAHADHVRGWLERNGRGGLKVVGSREFWDGVAVQDAKRTYRISNTLTGRFGRVEQVARKHCMTALFGQGGSA